MKGKFPVTNFRKLIWIYLARLSSFPEIAEIPENDIPIATGKLCREIQTGLFGGMESAQCLHSQIWNGKRPVFAFTNLRSNVLHSVKSHAQFPIPVSKAIVEVSYKENNERGGGGGYFTAITRRIARIMVRLCRTVLHKEQTPTRK